MHPPVACLLCKVILTGFIFLPRVFWERVAYLHVNSSPWPCSLAQSSKRGHLQGERREEGGERREEGGDVVWGATEVHSCFLWCGCINPFRIHGDGEWAVATGTPEYWSSISCEAAGLLLFIYFLITDFIFRPRRCVLGQGTSPQMPPVAVCECWLRLMGRCNLSSSHQGVTGWMMSCSLTHQS